MCGFTQQMTTSAKISATAPTSICSSTPGDGSIVLLQYSPLRQTQADDVSTRTGQNPPGLSGAFHYSLNALQFLGSLLQPGNCFSFKQNKTLLFSRTYPCILAASQRKQEILQLAPHEIQPAEDIHLHVDLYRAAWVAASPCRAVGKGCTEVTILTVGALLFSWQRSPFVLLINGFAGGR